MDKKVLNLVLSYKWYDEIEAGTKRIEYRAMSLHWTKLIWSKRNEITHVRFQRAYDKDTPTQEFELVKVVKDTCPYPSWNELYYCIHFK